MVKVSDEELNLLYPELSVEEGARKIAEQNAKLVLVTLGPKGVFYYAKDLEDDTDSENAKCGTVGCKKVKVVDTTGAGDSFTGGLLYCLTRKKEPFKFTRKELEKDLEFANAVASLCVTKRGAIPALPSRPEVEDFIKNS